jgi:hypoxanthine phosphoribosyltransferase
MMTGNNRTVLYLSKSKVAKIVSDTARWVDSIIEANPERDIVLVCVLNGSAPFFQSVVSNLSEIGRTKQCYIKLKSYSNNVQGGSVDTLLPLGDEITPNSVVILFEDIVDTGNSLNVLVSTLATKPHYSAYFVTLLSRFHSTPLAHKYWTTFSTIVVGHLVESKTGFLVGFGLDDNGYYRELDHILEIV